MIDVATQLADDVLAPAAQRVDTADHIPPAHFDALRGAGLFGVVGPSTHGGLDADPATMRRVFATIAGGCGATFFAWVQHHGVVGAVRRVHSMEHPDGGVAGGDVERLLTDLNAGSTVAGTAFAYLRNDDGRGVTARRIDAGWQFDGVAPWMTSWGIADVFLVAASTDDDRIVWGLLDAGPDRSVAGVEATPLPLVVFGSTGTVSVRFDRCRIPDDRVLFTEDLATWRRINRVQVAMGQPQSLGVAERCAASLRGLGDDDSIDAADRLHAAIDARWSDDRALTQALPALIGAEIDQPGSVEDAVVAASEHRTRCLDLSRVAAASFVAATGGRGMALDHPAQRLAREAAFYVIQAITDDGRRAALSSVRAQVDVRRHVDGDADTVSS